MCLMASIVDEEFQSYLDTLSREQKASLKPFLETYISENKRQQMQQVLEHRTRHVSVLLENVYQPHNAAAAVRSCECFGFQDLHVIELSHDYAINPDVTMGGCKWISLHRHGSEDGGTGAVLQIMKQSGFKIAATSLRPGCISLDQLPLEEPLALCFGTEESGLSEEAHEQADVFVQIPSYGFTQSFNVSVSVALSLSSIRNRLEASDIDWRLNEGEAEDLYLTWMLKTANRGLALARHHVAG
jgi:tRNA (guanosine-2'-O-)-methyltransferase